MALEAWYTNESEEDQRLPHHRDPNEYVPLAKLAELGVLFWHLDPKNYENDEELQKIRDAKGYNYMDLLDLCPGKVENYEEKLKNFFREHIHADEEIRYCFEGSGYFDVRDKEDRWIRIWIKEGDMIVLPGGIYHRFTLDTSNYIKLMRLFVGEPASRRTSGEEGAYEVVGPRCCTTGGPLDMKVSYMNVTLLEGNLNDIC